MSFVLVEKLTSVSREAPIFLRYVHEIGPVLTDDYDLAAKFDSRMDAIDCPAYYHTLTSFKVVQDDQSIIIDTVIEWIEGRKRI